MLLELCMFDMIRDYLLNLYWIKLIIEIGLNVCKWFNILDIV